MPDQSAPHATPDLPLPGYPISEAAVDTWFRHRHGRAPSEQELGAMLDAMAERDATPPHEGPHASPEGWVTGPSAPPATRR